MLKSLWQSVMSYLLAQDVPTLTRSVADGVRKVLTTPLAMLQQAVVTLPPRLLICLTTIVVLLSGAWIIWVF